MERSADYLLLQVRGGGARVQCFYIGAVSENDSTDRRPGNLTSWLDSLQAESWQLELLVSGFAIFLLLGGVDWVYSLELDIMLLQEAGDGYGLLLFVYLTARIAYLALIVILIVHVILRGLWIAAIGLRYVSGDIEYDQLKFQPRYRERLRNSIGSFDDYIEGLERYCSLAYALAFLLLFLFLSLSSWMTVTYVVQESWRWITGATSRSGSLLNTSDIVTAIPFGMGVIYLFDFATLGLLKRNRIVGKIYYPIYVVMGWITLARLYRPLYYNLIDQRFGRRIARLLPVAVVVILLGTSVKVVTHQYFPGQVGSGKDMLLTHFYLDESEFSPRSLNLPTLESRFARHGYVQLFLPYRPYYQDRVIEHMHPEVAVARYNGVVLDGYMRIGDWRQYNPEADNGQLLGALGDLFEVSVNERPVTVRPRFNYHQQREQYGLVYMIPTGELPPGENTVTVRSHWLDRQNSLRLSSPLQIYFYQ